MRLGVKDWKVIAAFVDGHPASGHKLDTDGRRLDGAWMGGRGIAEKGADGFTIHFNDLGSRSAQTVQRAVRGMAPPQQLAEFEGIKNYPRRSRKR